MLHLDGDEATGLRVDFDVKDSAQTFPASVELGLSALAGASAQHHLRSAASLHPTLRRWSHD